MASSLPPIASQTEGGYQMTFGKPISKLLLRPIKTGGENCAMNQSEFLALAVTCSKRKENHAYRGGGFAFLTPPFSAAITIDSHLKLL